MKHLLYEHQNNITELKRDGAVAVTLEQSQHHEREGDLNLEKRSLKVYIIILGISLAKLFFVTHRWILRKGSSHIKKP